MNNIYLIYLGVLYISIMILIRRANYPIYKAILPVYNILLFAKLLKIHFAFLILTAVLCVILCIYDLRWITPSILLYVGLIIYSVWMNSKKKTEIVNHIEEVTSDVDSATKGNLINSPIPMILMETDGRIIWRSRKFIDEFQNTDMSTYLTPMVKEIKL